MSTCIRALILLGLFAGSARASELRLDWNGHFVHLSVAGNFSQYTIERTLEGAGEWRLLEWNPIGCTAECNYDDYGIEAGSAYEYRVRVLLSGGAEGTFGPARVEIDAARSQGLEVRVQPHPVTEGTTLHFHIPGPAAHGGSVPVSFTLYDPAGRIVRKVDHGPFPAGRHTLSWDGRDDAGRQLPTGTYFYRVEVPGLGQSGRLIVIR